MCTKSASFIPFILYSHSPRKYCTCIDRACELISLRRWIELNSARYPSRSTACACSGVIPEAVPPWNVRYVTNSVTVSRMAAGPEFACSVSQDIQDSAYTEALKDKNFHSVTFQL